MRDDQEFNIEFVNMVRRQQCLYDKSVADYRSKEAQDRAWTQIGNSINENVSHCKERWRNLRACLSRHLKQQVNGSAYHKPYYLSEHMAFVLPFTRTRSSLLNVKQEMGSGMDQSQPIYSTPTPIEVKFAVQKQSNGSTEHNDQLTHQQLVEEHLIEEITNPTERTNQSLPTNIIYRFVEEEQQQPTGHPDPDIDEQSQLNGPVSEEDDTFSEPDMKRQRLESLATQTDPWEPIERPKVCTAESDDADLNFFRSLLPDIRMMNSTQKRRFKMKCFQTIDEILCETN